MPQSYPKYFTRKDLAQILEASVDFVKTNEKQLGLDKAKVKIGHQFVRYRSSVVIVEFQKRGLEI